MGRRGNLLVRSSSKNAPKSMQNLNYIVRSSNISVFAHSIGRLPRRLWLLAMTRPLGVNGKVKSFILSRHFYSFENTTYLAGQRMRDSI
jgi:hypothetical protein